MECRPTMVALGLLGVTTLGLAQPGPLLTPQNNALYFPAVDLTTNGIPGLTNSAPRLMVSSVNTNSTQGGRITLVNTQAWVSRYVSPGYNNQPHSMVTDDTGNVIVTGFAGNTIAAGTGDDFITLKYAPDGTPLWTNRYDGAFHGQDWADYVAVDADGNVFVTGNSQTSTLQREVLTIKYSPAGVALWTNHYCGSATNYDFPGGFAVDGAGNSYIAVSTFTDPQDITTLKYDTSGNAVWTNRYKATAIGADYPSGLLLDSAGDVLIAGGSGGVVTGLDYVTLKYAADGAPLWTNRYHRVSTDQARAMAVDRAGNVIVTGESLGSGGPVMSVTIKYASNGSPLWTNLMGGPNYSGGAVPRIVVDASDNVIVTGGWPGATSIGNYFNLKLTSDGLPVWTNQYAGLGNSNGWVAGTLTDSAGNFYLAGYTTVPGASNRDYVAVKFDPAGNAIWTNRYNGPTDSEDDCFAVTADQAGNLYLTGESRQAFGKFDYATLKYTDYVLYTPPMDFFGTDSFAFTVVDPFGNSTTSVVTVVVSPLFLQFNTRPDEFHLVGDGLLLRLDGAEGTNPVVIHASTNLADWQAIATNPPVLGTVLFLDRTTNVPLRFYRASQLQ